VRRSYLIGPSGKHLHVTAIASVFAFMIAGICGDELVVTLQILDTSLESSYLRAALVLAAGVFSAGAVYLIPG
jgi:hypothetical protein